LILSVLCCSPSIAQTKPEPQWTELPLIDLAPYGLFRSTSALNHTDEYLDIKKKYGAVYLFDKDYTTTWAEGKSGAGIGEAIYTVIPEGCRTISIFSGYGKSESLYNKNNRPKTISLTCLIGINPSGYVTETHAIFKSIQLSPTYTIELEDVFGVQRFPFPFNDKKLKSFKNEVSEKFKNDYKLKAESIQVILKLTITDVYKGKKYDDTCISEIYFNTLYISDLPIIYPGVKDVYTSENESAVFINDSKNNQIKVLEDKQSVFQVIDTSADHKWIVLIKMPAEVGQGRVDTEYILLNTYAGKIENSNLENVAGGPIHGPFFLKKDKDSLFLEYSMRGESDVRFIEIE